MITPRAAPALDSSTKSATKALKQAGRGVDGAVSSTCPRCAASFVCGANAASCWCETLAVLDLKRRPEDLLGKGCLCEVCLRAVISESANEADANSPNGADADSANGAATG